MITAKEDSQNAKPLCVEHNCELNYYCGSCEKSLCMCCALTKHSGHNYGTTEQMITRHKDGIRAMNAVLEKMTETITKMQEHVGTVMRNQSEELDKIDQHYDGQIRNLVEQKEKTKAQIRDHMSKKEEAVVAQQTELDVIQKEIQGIRRLNEMLEKISGKEVFSADVKKQKQLIDDCMQGVDTKRRKIDSQLTQIDDTLFSTIDFTPFKQSIFNPASCELVFPESLYVRKPITATLFTKDVQGNLCTHHSNEDIDSEVCVEIESITGKIVRAEVEDNNDGSYKVTFTPQHIGNAKLRASISGQQVKGSPYDVTVHCDYNQVSFARVSSNEIGGDSKQPWDIAIGKCGIWAVTDYHNHCIYFFNEFQQKYGNLRILKKLGSHGNGDGQFKNPRGIVFDSNNNLFVVDGNNHRIQKFDMRGNFLLQFGSKGAGAGQLSSPHGVALHNGRVYIADSGNKRISVFQTSGQFCHNIGEQLVGVPCDVTVSNNKLLVAVYGQNCLIAFTLDGQSKGNFCTLNSTIAKSNNLFSYNQKITNSNMFPYSLTSDLNGFVIVSGTYCQWIEVFDEGGKLVKSLGGRVGGQSAEFCGVHSNHSRNVVCYPLGVAVSLEGSIQVITADESSIQKLVQEDFPMS